MKVLQRALARAFFARFSRHFMKYIVYATPYAHFTLRAALYALVFTHCTSIHLFSHTGAGLKVSGRISLPYTGKQRMCVKANAS